MFSIIESRESTKVRRLEEVPINEFSVCISCVNADIKKNEDIEESQSTKESESIVSTDDTLIQQLTFTLKFCEDSRNEISLRLEASKKSEQSRICISTLIPR